MIRLVGVITASDSRTGKYAAATDNAISSVGKVILSGVVDNSKLIPMWLSWLPTTADDVESKVIYGQLCDLIER